MQQVRPGVLVRVRTWRGAVVGLLLLAVLVTACSKGGPGASPTGSGQAAPLAPKHVRIHLVAYDPAALSVAGGTTVIWKQEDPGFHTVTSGTATTDATGAISTHPDGKFDSGKLSTGKTFSFTFSQPGTYPYFCQIHPGTMHGAIKVT